MIHSASEIKELLYVTNSADKVYFDRSTSSLNRTQCRLLIFLQGGCIDSTNQSMAALFMVLGQTDVSKLVIGPLTPYT